MSFTPTFIEFKRQHNHKVVSRKNLSHNLYLLRAIERSKNSDSNLKLSISNLNKRIKEAYVPKKKKLSGLAMNLFDRYIEVINEAKLKLDIELEAYDQILEETKTPPVKMTEVESKNADYIYNMPNAMEKGLLIGEDDFDQDPPSQELEGGIDQWYIEKTKARKKKELQELLDKKRLDSQTIDQEIFISDDESQKRQTAESQKFNREEMETQEINFCDEELASILSGEHLTKSKYFNNKKK